MSSKPLLQLVGSVILLIAVISVYSTWYGMVAAQGTQIATTESEITAKTTATTRTAQAEVQLTSLAADEATINQYFISTDTVVPFLENIESTGKYLGASVTVVSVSATPGTPYGQLTLSLKIVGSFNAIARTIGAIEYGPYDIQNTSLTLLATPNQVSTSSSPSTWTASGNFTVATQAPPTPTQPATTDTAPSTTGAPTPAAVPASTPTEPTASSSTMAATSTATSSVPTGPIAQ